MSFAEKEKFIIVPAKLVKFNKGFGMDIGKHFRFFCELLCTHRSQQLNDYNVRGAVTSFQI
jgi:hypothetical protein